jgi:tetratricopeptide (TPR) repeat protein
LNEHLHDRRAIEGLLDSLRTPGPGWTIARPVAGDGVRLALRRALALEQWEEGHAGVLWLEAGGAHPWLVAPWPDTLMAAVGGADDVGAAVRTWCAEARAVVVVEGGDRVPEGLAPGEAQHLRVLWLPDTDDVAAPGWEPTTLGAAAAAPGGERDPVAVPLALVAIDAPFTTATARAVTGDDGLDLSALVAEGFLERRGEGRWTVSRRTRARLLAHAPAALLEAARRAWEATLLVDWPPRPDTNTTVEATLSEAGALWRDWYTSGRVDEWAALSPSWSRWARRFGEQARVRAWHELMLGRTGSGPVEARARLAFALSRSESDLGRFEGATRWAEQGMALLPPDHILRVNGYQQIGSAAWARSDITSALAFAEEGVAFCERHGVSPAKSAPLLSDLAFYRLLAGRPENAEAPLRAAIAVKRAAGGATSVVFDLNVLAMLLLALDRPAEAIDVAREGLDACSRESNADAPPYLLHVLSMTLLELGRVQEAYDALVHAFERLSPSIHDSSRPLLDITRTRIAMRSAGGSGATAADALATVERAMPDGEKVHLYAGLLLADALERELADHDAAAALLERLGRLEGEGHVHALIRSARARVASPARRATGGAAQGRGAGAAASLSELELDRMRKLLERFG